jgi:glutathione-regulated potassium-efflux system protein KefB
MYVTLLEVAVLLAAAAIAAPLAKLARVGTVLGYLIAGVLLGPYGIGGVFSIYAAQKILHFSEFGIVLLLFLIGLELRPKRLQAMRGAVFGLGGTQVAVSAAVLTIFGMLVGLPVTSALYASLALALSSTAFALQVLEETGEIRARHGRLAFAVLLFQDLAAIPLIALAPVFAITAGGKAPQMDLWAALLGLATIGLVVLVGHFALDRVFRLIARTRVKEAMTAAALLVIIGITLVMQQAGLSASLGAFIAGALLAESSYRHEIEADIQPFQGLLLGVFFTAVGMSLNLNLVIERPDVLLSLTFALIAIKGLILYGLGRWQGLAPGPARRLGISISQGGEFAFVLFAASVAYGVLSQIQAQVMSVVVTLSMAATPLLLGIDHLIARYLDGAAPDDKFDSPPEADDHVVIAGFGRFGQIVARVLRAKQIHFTALDISPDQIALVERFGQKAFYGDASRRDVLEAAQTGKARAFVLAIDDVEASLRTAELVRAIYPALPVYARARNRNHAHRLLDVGVKIVQRETFLSALEITHGVLREMNVPEREITRAIGTFRSHDERRLIEDYKHFSDIEKILDNARSDAATLERLFAEDVEEEAKLTQDEPEQRPPEKKAAEKKSKDPPVIP